MKNLYVGIYLGFGILILAITAVAVGCGQQTSTTPTTTLPVSGIVSISGKLSTGVVASSAGMKAQVAASAVSGYSVAAVSTDTGMVYFADAKTGSDGSFTVSGLPSGESFYLEILDDTSKLAAPVSMGTSEGKPVMAVEPSVSTDLGTILYDSSKGAAAPVTEPTAILDKGTSAEVKTGETLVPVGAKNFGKGDEAKFSGTYTPDKADGDKDGLPNPFDADNNGDGVVDELDGLYTREAFMPAGVLPNFFTYVFSNLKIDFDRRDSFKAGPTAYSDMTLAVGVTSNAGKGAPSGKTISSVKVTEGPTWMSKATVVDSGGRLWSADSYSVPAKGAGSVFEVQLGGLKPLTDVNAGDALKFLVTYTDGSSEEAIKMLNFIFTDIPRATEYRIGSGGSWQTISPTASGPLATSSTSEVYLKWTRPRDETSKEVFGGRYTFEYNVAGGGAHEVTVYNDSDPTIATLEAGYNLGSLSDADFSAGDFMVGLCIRSLANDNAAENLRFTRGW